jgi:WD40 repeat protein
VTASDDRTARIWDAESGQEVRALAGHPERVFGAVFSADGRRIVTASADRTARVWDVESGQELRRFTGHQGSVLSAAFSSDGLRIVTASEDSTARIWTLPPPQDVWELARQRKHRDLTEAERKEFYLTNE